MVTRVDGGTLAKTGFPGFPTEGIEFFRKLVKNNRREWFQPRKEVFETRLKQPMRELVHEVNREMGKFAPEYVTDPDRAIYRIYRDTRFSKDKTPYKDHIAASFRRSGDCPHEGAGFYFAVSHKEVAIGGGIYMPPPESLKIVRQHLAEHHEEFRKLLRAKALRDLYSGVKGEQLTRPPKGFAPEHPAADLIRYKQLYFYEELVPELATSGELQATVVRYLKAIAPFVRFLNSPLQRKSKPIIPDF
jgi:uncharacterized protein (TIGR02453 family)